jgi:hypothetical protein
MIRRTQASKMKTATHTDTAAKGLIREGRMEAIENARNLTKQQKKALKTKVSVMYLKQLSIDLNSKPQHAKAALEDLAPPQEGKDAIRNIFVYCIFMVFFTLQTSRGLGLETIYFFGNNIKAQLTEVEFKPQHSPQFGKTFNHISTAEEFYQWMLG